MRDLHNMYADYDDWEELGEFLIFSVPLHALRGIVNGVRG